MEKKYRELFKEFQKNPDVCIDSIILGYNRLWFRFLHKDENKLKGDMIMLIGNDFFCTDIGIISPSSFKIIFDSIPFSLTEVKVEYYDDMINSLRTRIEHLQKEKQCWTELIEKKNNKVRL